MLTGLSKREKRFLISGAVFLFLFLGYQFGIAPVFENRNTLFRIFEQKQAALAEMIVLEKQIALVSNRVDLDFKNIPTRKKGFSLFAFLDSQARQSGVKENVVFMKPFSKKMEGSDYVMETVKVKLSRVYLKEFLDFLNRIEPDVNGVDITSLAIVRVGEENRTLDIVLETQALMPQKN